MRTTTGMLAGALLAAMAMAGRADAQPHGEGHGSAANPPPTKSSGTAAEAAELRGRDLPLAPRLGLLGAPGAALDSAGPSRLGGRGERAAGAWYGERARAAPAGGETSQAWQAGDRVRSSSSADVRAARGQQAPDLEWAGAEAARQGGPRHEPQEPYGVRFSNAQQPRSTR